MIGERHRVRGEIPGILRDAAALAGGHAIVVDRVALTVPVDRPERVPAQAGTLREGQYLLEIVLVKVFAYVCPAVHSGEAFAGIGLRAGPAERAHQLGVEILQRGDLRGAAAEAAVERHDRVVVRGESQALSLVEQLLAEVVRAGGGGRHGDRDEQPRILSLQDLRGAQLVGDGRRVLDLRFLEVEVDRVQAVRGDHLLVGGRRGRGRTAHLAQLRAVVAARRDDHVAPSGTDPADDAGHLGVSGHWVGPVPRRCARTAAGQDEGHVERLLPGRGHHLAEVRAGRV